MLWGPGCPFSSVGEFEEKIEKWYVVEVLIRITRHTGVNKVMFLGGLMGWS